MPSIHSAGGMTSYAEKIMQSKIEAIPAKYMKLRRLGIQNYPDLQGESERPLDISLPDVACPMTSYRVLLSYFSMGEAASRSHHFCGYR